MFKVDPKSSLLSLYLVVASSLLMARLKVFLTFPLDVDYPPLSDLGEVLRLTVDVGCPLFFKIFETSLTTMFIFLLDPLETKPVLSPYSKFL
jgi:hypothetical protein